MSEVIDRIQPARSTLRGLSLRTLLLGSLVVVVVVMLGLVSLSVFGLMRRSAEHERRRAAAALADAAAHTLAQTDAAATEQLLAAWQREQRIDHYQIVDLPYGQGGVSTEFDRGDDGARIVRATAPVPGNERRAVVLTLSLARFDGQLASAQSLVVLYGVVVGLAVLVLGYLLVTRSVVRPVRRLVRAVERVGAGDLDTRISVGGVGEVAELSERFNEMVRAVRQARDETARGVERLAATNAELTTSNQALERAHDELVRSERLASIGQLSAGIAHEIGNPLSSILAYLELLREEPDMPPDEALDLLARTEDATRRIHHIIRELLDYSRADARSLATLDPGTAVRQAERLVAPQPRLRHVTLRNTIETPLPAVSLDEPRLVQVLVNLLLNAADALTDHEPLDGQRPTIEIRAEVTNEAVTLQVADNGPGIPDDALPHIFEPFFTTREPGKGTGLGLAICERLVEQMGARLDVSTSPRGTTFVVSFEL